MFAPLFQNMQIGSLKLANRFVRSATWEGMCEADGTPTSRLENLYATLARGATGLIVSGYSYVRADGKQLAGKMAIDRDSLIPALERLVQAVHREGGKIFCQLVHAGGQTTAKTIGTTPVAPSSLTAPNYPETPRELAEEEILELVGAFAEGARRAKEAGFDGIQLHGAHGYLINQFLSPLMNRRSDKFGGSPENRMRFVEEVFKAVREEVGGDYPVTIKLTATDHLDGGFTIDEAITVARRLNVLGIDAIEVSSGTSASGEYTPVRRNIDISREAYNAAYAQQVRDAVDIPVMTVGGLRSPLVMKRLVDDGATDLIALSRPLIREPDLIRQWKKGRIERAACISCNGCFRPGLKEGGIYCVIDRIERENEGMHL